MNGFKDYNDKTILFFFTKFIPKEYKEIYQQYLTVAFGISLALVTLIVQLINGSLFEGMGMWFSCFALGFFLIWHFKMRKEFRAIRLHNYALQIYHERKKIDEEINDM